MGFKNNNNQKLNPIWYWSVALCFMLAIVYWLTNYPSITWWVGSQYSIMAVCLGVAPAPGSILLTIIGWLVTKLPFGISDALLLNCLGGLFAILTTVLGSFIALRAIPDSSDNVTLWPERWLKHSAIVISTLLFGLSFTVWRYAIIFQPYILTVLFTALILWATLRWSELAGKPESYRWLFIILLLFGLDFSVHRTNLLMLPGLLVWILICYPKTIRQLKAWVVGLTGFVIGLAFHFVTMFIASMKPVFNAENASNLNAFYHYVSLKQVGGNWLVNLWPRKADFFSIQLADYWQVLSDNFFFTDGPLGWFGLLPVLLLFVGIVAVWQSNRKLTLGLLILLFCSSLGGVIYFNTPENYYWPMDRHYLPSFLIFTIFIAIGAGRTAIAVWSSSIYHKYFTALFMALLLALPTNALLRNYNQIDSSDKHFAYDFASNILENLEPNAILIVQGDNLWPLLYLQIAEDIRPDVTLLSQSLMNTQWYMTQAKEMDRELPIILSDDDFQFHQWADSTISIEYLPIDRVDTTKSIAINIPPTVTDRFLLAQDWITLKMLIENKFKRPIYFTVTPEWLQPHTRHEGLVWQVMPELDDSLDTQVLYDNLVNNYSFRGYNDPDIPLDKLSAIIGGELYRSFVMLARAKAETGDSLAFNKVLETLEQNLPAARIETSEQWTPILKQMQDSISTPNAINNNEKVD